MAEIVLSSDTHFDSVLPHNTGPSTAAALGTATIWLGPWCPDPGERAAGYGMAGTIVAVHRVQPLSSDHIWRVTLAGEAYGRLVRFDGHRSSGWWLLLQVDDLTDSQLETLDAVLTT